MNDAQAAQFLHWFWVTFFAVFGIGVLVMPRSEIGAKRTGWLLRVEDESVKSRVQAALRKRCEMEKIAPFVKIIPGAVSLIVSAVAALTPVEPGVLYGIVLLSGALSMTLAFVQLRNRQPVRVAVLSRRSASAVIPAIWFAAAALQGVLALSVLRVQADALGAVFVCVSTLACTILAWRVTEMPALLAGDDVEVERLLDERLRFHRAASVLFLALAQTFVFITQVAPFHPEASLEFATIGSAFLWVAYSSWFFIRFLRKTVVAAAPA